MSVDITVESLECFSSAKLFIRMHDLAVEGKSSKDLYSASYLVLNRNTIVPHSILNITQPAFTCSKLTIETLEQGVKYVQS